jgi:hypothetical protein
VQWSPSHGLLMAGYQVVDGDRFVARLRKGLAGVAADVTRAAGNHYPHGTFLVGYTLSDDRK